MTDWRFIKSSSYALAAMISLATMKPVFAQSPSPDAALQARVAEADNRFAFKLLSALARENFSSKAPGNLFISPASIAWAFDMLLNGAEAETLAALTQSLELQGLGLKDINAANQSLRTALQAADPQVQLAIANSLWLKPGYQFLPPFLATAQQFYQAEVKSLESAAIINAWVSAATRGKITTILRQEDILPESILFLLNALYFKGAWKSPFDKAQTVPLPFHLLSSQTRPQAMMHKSGRFSYFEDAKLQAVEIPYGNGRFGFFVLLPAAATSLQETVAALDAPRWQAILAQRAPRPGKIALPRFKIEYSVELAQTLQNLGMKLPFTRQANFSKLAQVPPGWWIQISSVKHKTFVEVNEEGTEAAAVTAIGMQAGSAPPPPEAPFTMVVDRPFFAAIRDNSSGLLLFVGAIVDPQ